MWKYTCQLMILQTKMMIDEEITFGAAMGYSSGKNSSSLKTPPS